MSQLLRMALGAPGPMILFDPEYERTVRSLRTRREICPEENAARVANRRFSEVSPLSQESIGGPAKLPVSEYNHQENREAVSHGDLDWRIASAPQPRKVNSYLADSDTTCPSYLPNMRSTLDQSNLHPINPASNTLLSDSIIAEQPASQRSSINTTIGTLFGMTGTRIPVPNHKSRPFRPPASRPQNSTPTAASVRASREDSTPSLLSPETRDGSIRIVKPDLTLSPPHKPKGAVGDSISSQTGNNQSITMHGKKQASPKSQNITQVFRSGVDDMDEHSRSHPRSPTRYKQHYDEPGGYSRGPPLTKPDSTTQNENARSEPKGRGRAMRRRYEFIDSDDKICTVPDSVRETAKKGDGDGNIKGTNDNSRESNMTTMTDLMRQCMEGPSPKIPPRRNHHQLANGNEDTSVIQPSLAQPKSKHRPHPLNLKDPIYVGMVGRHDGGYEIEQIAIKSSQAEHFNLHSSNTGSSVYEDNVETSPAISPLHIPNYNESRVANPLQSYNKWRENSNPIRAASQGSVRIKAPTYEDNTPLAKERVDEDKFLIVERPNSHDVPVIAKARSRSTLGIREDRNQEKRHRQFSNESAYTASEYSTATPFGYESGITRSATMNDVFHRDRQFSGGSGPNARQRGVIMNDVPSQMEPETETTSPPFTPLTPFIMKVSGAPAGAERGTKMLFGEHGWLEDTAASSVMKLKMEKTGGFMESLKRKAREIADSTSFKPGRNTRTSIVNRINISLDAREQSLLYCELEYNLNNALDAYLKVQLNSGRLDAGKLSRIADGWAQKGRPKVISFRYDLETQVDLIMLHIDEFRFYGQLQAEGSGAIAGLLYAMKTNARYMRIRTFCQPDSVIAKHVLDAQNLVRLLGSPECVQRTLEEVAQFFKVAVDRRRVMAETPAGRQAGRVTSNGSAQRVRFQDHNGERRRRGVETLEINKLRTGMGGQNHGNVKIQPIMSRGESRGRN